MTGSAFLDALLGALGALAAAWGVYAGGRKALADARALKEPPPTPYEALAGRVTALEASDAEKGREISRLRRQVRRLAGVMTSEVAHLVTWIHDGSNPPPPDKELAVINGVIRDIETDEEP